MIKSIERQIAEATIQVLLNAGYSISVWEGEDFAIKRSRDPEAILAELASTATDHLMVYKGAADRDGWVFFVYGNDKDIISDYTTNLEDVLKPVFAMIDEYDDRKTI